MTVSSGRTRAGALSLAAAGIAFVLYPARRPWTDESTVDGAVTAMASGAWVIAHAAAMVGFILVSLGLLALWTRLRGTPGEGLARAAVVASVVGSGLTLPYYGAEDFGLHVIATRAAAGEPLDVLAMVEAVRYNPVAVTMFGVGLVTLAVSGLLVGLAVARSGRLARASGWPFAVGYLLFLPQFFGPPAVRIAHGVLLGLGLVWLAFELWRSGERA